MLITSYLLMNLIHKTKTAQLDLIKFQLYRHLHFVQFQKDQIELQICPKKLQVQLKNLEKSLIASAFDSPHCFYSLNALIQKQGGLFLLLPIFENNLNYNGIMNKNLLYFPTSFREFEFWQLKPCKIRETMSEINIVNAIGI
ncbi:unnamed protein product (macronuclear) [Paramecium tetraurelia]|uniref:Uncharacterized protein n=1 Tax=Paramecium tetraurelia TaxID=5888 RepID=A0C344_PARTE|nr:uncharacterized protein GSPATT00034689001 [Paramecium tetraurelia]CAK65211.1 unnamed protein product [Paramecium tetraurelia]|eukprot:XP_001432608.1 hypothetical protein (macronuclear) [Paramecium tetraurelia strain d4-2]